MTAEQHQRPGWITVDQATKLLAVSAEWLRQLAKRGVIPRAEKGCYPLVSLVQGFIRHLRQDAEDSTAAAAGRRLADSRIREVELRIAEREHRVFPRDEHMAVVDELCGLFISEMNGLPARVTRDLEIRGQIRTQIDAMRERLSARAQQRSTEWAATGTSGAAG